MHFQIGQFNDYLPITLQLLRLRELCAPFVPRLQRRPGPPLRPARLDVRRLQDVPGVRRGAEERGPHHLRVLRPGSPLLLPRPATREAAQGNDANAK